MKNSFYLLLLLFLVPVLSSCQVNNNRTIQSFEWKGKKLKYAIQLPKDFKPEKTYPVMIGPSEVEGKDVQSFYWRNAPDTYGWIVVDFRMSRKESLVGLMEHLKSQYKVEGNKFHAACFSANSSGIFELIMQVPEYFAGINGIAGNPGTTDKNKLKRLKGVKVQFIVGDKDPYWKKAAEGRHAILQEIGVESSIDIIKNGPHVLQKLVGKGFLEKANRLR